MIEAQIKALNLDKNERFSCLGGTKNVFFKIIRQANYKNSHKIEVYTSPIK